MRRAPLLLVAAACAAPEPAPGLPEGTGKGLLRADATPAEVETCAAPVWKPGDRFVWRRGGAHKVATRVGSAGPDGYELVDEDSKIVLRYTKELGELGQRRDGIAEATIEMAPADLRYHWPLFVGKRWEVEVLLKVPGQAPRALRLEYHVEAKEALEVPAGRFVCYRICRRSRAAGNARGLEIVAFHWYAPEVGHFVRRLENNVMLELERVERAN